MRSLQVQYWSLDPSQCQLSAVDAGRELPGPSASQLHLSRISLSNLSPRTHGAFFSASIPSLNITNLPLPISSHEPSLLPYRADQQTKSVSVEIKTSNNNIFSPISIPIYSTNFLLSSPATRSMLKGSRYQ